MDRVKKLIGILSKIIFMSKSSVSMPYLVAWILGIICLVVAVYFIYRYITKSELSCSECSAEVSAWCVRCYKIYGSTNWGSGNLIEDKLKKCMDRCNISSYNINDCNSAFNFCKGYIPF